MILQVPYSCSVFGCKSPATTLEPRLMLWLCDKHAKIFAKDPTPESEEP